jgi:fluoroquinolone resistance protein
MSTRGRRPPIGPSVGSLAVTAERVVRHEDWDARDLSGESHSRVEFLDVDFTECTGVGAVFADCTFRDCRFNASSHTEAAFLNCTFTGCSFFDATLTRCKLAGAVIDAGQALVLATAMGLSVEADLDLNET